jgi:hypothetical protein
VTKNVTSIGERLILYEVIRNLTRKICKWPLGRYKHGYEDGTEDIYWRYGEQKKGRERERERKREA